MKVGDIQPVHMREQQVVQILEGGLTSLHINVLWQEVSLEDRKIHHCILYMSNEIIYGNSKSGDTICLVTSLRNIDNDWYMKTKFELLI